MRLPQEICDIIIDHLYNDKRSLHHCSLVSRRWVYRSQAHIFHFLILGDKSLASWFDTFSPSDQRIHSFVKVLTLYLPSVRPRVNFMRFAEYAPAFKNLERSINGRKPPHDSWGCLRLRWFGHLKHTLKALSLESVATNLRIIAEFPQLESLVVRYCRLPSVGDFDEGGDIPESDLHDAFRGSLELDTHPWAFDGELLATLADFPLGYDTIKINVELVIGKMYPRGLIDRFISRCSNTLEVLDIEFEDGAYSDLDLSPSRRLREISLGLVTDHNSRTNFPRFSAITSGTMSKITITAKLGSPAAELYRIFGGKCDWAGVDRDLVRLAEFQGGNNAQRLGLVIDLRRANLGPPHPSGKETKNFRRSSWVKRASKHAFPKFSQAGTIDFILPPSPTPLPSGYR